jgi:hypothetical protein
VSIATWPQKIGYYNKLLGEVSLAEKPYEEAILVFIIVNISF